jgi:hypothetical protein
MEIGETVHLVLRPLVVLLSQPRMVTTSELGSVSGTKIGRGNISTRRKPTPVPHGRSQTPFDMTWDRTRAAAVGNQRLTA